MNKNSWNDIWKNKKYYVPEQPSLNITYFYNHHLKKLKKNSKILDHGCGNARNFSFLKKKGFKVTGIDLSKNIIDKNKKKFPNNKKNFFFGNIKELNFDKDYFDVIISEASLYYQTKKKIFDEVKEFHRILKKGGQIRVYTKSVFDKYYSNKKINKTYESVLKINHWEKDLTITFLDINDVKKLFSNFKKVSIGLEEFNYINYKKKHSYWIITAEK